MTFFKLLQSTKAIVSLAVISPFMMASTAGAQSSGQVTLYQHCNYTGYAVSLPAGSYSMSSLQSKGMKNDDISSIKVPAGQKVQIYQHAGYAGKSKTFESDVSCLVSHGMNDELSSVKVASKSSVPIISGPGTHYRKRQGVTGQSVVASYFPQGRLEETYDGSAVWHEYNSSGQKVFSFKETHHDAWSVYLTDSSRGVNLQVDVHRNKIRYGDKNTEMRDQYTITHSERMKKR